MNRAHTGKLIRSVRAPRTRADEPETARYLKTSPAVLPAHAGMNRNSHRLTSVRTCAPRTRGDEPSRHGLVLSSKQVLPALPSGR